MARKKIFILFTVVLALLFIVLTSELVIRIKHSSFKSAEDYHGQTTKGVFGDSDLQNCQWGGTLYPHPYLGIAHLNTKKAERCLGGSVNSAGMFSNEYPKARNEKFFDILVMGGSVAYNLQKSNPFQGETPGPIVDMIEKNYTGPKGRAIRVFGGAIGSWKQPQQLINYLIHQEVFDGMIAVEGANEISVDHSHRFHRPFYLSFQVARYPDNDMYLKRKFLKLLEVLKNKLNSSYLLAWMHINFSSKVELEHYEKHLKTMSNSYFNKNKEEISFNSKDYFKKQYSKYLGTLVSLANINNQKLAIFIQPTLYQKETRSKQEKKIVLNDYNIDKDYVSIANFLEEKFHRKVYSLANLFKNDARDLYLDYVHFKYDQVENKGHKKIVDAIIQRLVKDWGLKKKPTKK